MVVYLSKSSTTDNAPQWGHFTAYSTISCDVLIETWLYRTKAAWEANLQLWSKITKCNLRVWTGLGFFNPNTLKHLQLDFRSRLIYVKKQKHHRFSIQETNPGCSSVVNFSHRVFWMTKSYVVGAAWKKPHVWLDCRKPTTSLLFQLQTLTADANGKPIHMGIWPSIYHIFS